jgi:LAGLIDADG DNA endonuclease family
MDDGGKLDYNKKSKNEGLVLNTQSFTEKEVKRMSIELSNKFNLSTNVRLNKNKNVIVIKSESYKIFKDLIDPYIIASMRYKLHT